MLDSQVRLGRTTGAAFLCAALVLFVAAICGLASRTYAQTSRRLDGQVLNGTQAAPPEGTANLDVTLFQMGASGPVTNTAQTDAQGRFSFPDLKVDPNSPFFVRVDYEGIHYFSDSLSPDIQTSQPLTLTVYETQTVPTGFQIDNVHFVLDVGDKSLSGIELIQVKNSTDRAFKLTLPLPQGLSDLQFNDPRDQFRAVAGADGSIAFPILPTTEQVLFGVQMTTQPPDYTLKLQVPVKIGRLNVLVAQTGGVQVASPQLRQGPVFTPQSGTNYWQLNGDNIPADSQVSVAVSNLPGGDNSAMIRNVVLGVGGLAALTLLALPFVRRRGTRLPPLGSGDTERSETNERLERLQAIADLDDAFETGQIPQDEYRMQRATLKAELMQALQESSRQYETDNQVAPGRADTGNDPNSQA